MLRLLQSIIFLFLWFGTVYGCVDSYLDFEEQTFGNNSENRLKLYQAFYPPNDHLPYSVVVSYQAVLPNGTQVNISTNPSCPYTQVWIWLSSPVFLFLEPTSLNRHTLFILNYFEEWIPPHVTITTPYPCQDQAEGFLQQITTSVSCFGASLCVVYVVKCYLCCYIWIQYISDIDSFCKHHVVLLAADCGRLASFLR